MPQGDRATAEELVRNQPLALYLGEMMRSSGFDFLLGFALVGLCTAMTILLAAIAVRVILTPIGVAM